MATREDLIDDTLVTEDMIFDCFRNPVLSRHHDFRSETQKASYDILPARGRTLYDSLRTKFDVPHGEAFDAAYQYFGLSAVVYL